MPRIRKKTAKRKRKLVLPKKRTPACTDLSKYTMLLYGREKIGKTSLASQFPETLFLFFEPGGIGLDLFEMSIESWESFQD